MWTMWFTTERPHLRPRNTIHLIQPSKCQKEHRILLAIQLIKSGQIKGIQAAAKAYNVPHRTRSYHVYDRLARVDSSPNCRKY